MEPVIEFDGARVFHGDCRDVLAALPDNSVDSIVTDPPYELGFMGKSWDASGIAYNSDVWEQCLRVLKPGGHILAFGGTRTWHRLAVAIEDAGFEIRDNIAWMYGSGFPKSLDVSKAIDKKRDDSEESDKIATFVRRHIPKGFDWIALDALLGTVNARQKFATASTSGMKSRVPSWEQWQLMKGILAFDDSMDAEVWRLNGRKGKPGEAWFEREVIGQKMSGIADKNEKGRHTIGASKAVEVDITAPSTSEAQKWQGWGTALKPAFEPVVVARKPLSGTVAETVLEWGTGGLNIDGSRIGSEILPGQKRGDSVNTAFMSGGDTPEREGRWPANVILDEVTAGLLDEQSGQAGGGFGVRGKGGQTYANGKGFANTLNETGQTVGYGDTGGASRFFYCAKASKRDRNEGLEELETRSAADTVEREEGSPGMESPRAGAGRTSGAKNFHPTVKPTALMRYLVKLVTPPGGTVLDPFTGSGSTGKAAILEGFDFVGVELTDDYLPIIEGRLKWALENQDEGTLF